MSAAGFYGLDQMLRGAREGDAANGTALLLWRYQALWPGLLIPVLAGPFLTLQGGVTWCLLRKAPWYRSQGDGPNDS